MEDFKFKKELNTEDIEELKKTQAEIMGVKKEDVVFAGIQFIFIQKDKDFRTSLQMTIPEYKDEDYED